MHCVYSNRLQLDIADYYRHDIYESQIQYFNNVNL